MIVWRVNGIQIALQGSQRYAAPLAVARDWSMISAAMIAWPFANVGPDFHVCIEAYLDIESATDPIMSIVDAALSLLDLVGLVVHKPIHGRSYSSPVPLLRRAGIESAAIRRLIQARPEESSNRVAIQSESFVSLSLQELPLVILNSQVQH